MTSSSPKVEGRPFPWHIPLHDAHCHPLEEPSSLDNLNSMHTASLTVFATRIEDQDVMASIAKKHTPLILTKDTKVIPGFGYHPWFSHTFYDDVSISIAAESINTPEIRKEHYQKVLLPAPEDDVIAILPALTPLSTALDLIRKNLQAYPLAMVGEIGLDKPFRIPEPWPDRATEDAAMALGPKDRPRGGRCRRPLSLMKVDMEHQKKVLLAQLRIAGEFGRAVSVHGVGCHGILTDVIKQSWAGNEKLSGRSRRRKEKQDAMQDQSERTEADAKTPFPLRICLHSFSGTVDSIKPYFASNVPAEMFLTFAWCNNFSTESSGRKAEEVIKWVPEKALLVESDLHSVGAKSDEVMENMARKICEVRGWTLENGCRILSRNWWRFVTGEDSNE
jgi:Tat protein secretion system quality control protein TatD with DNase activity